MLSFPPFRLDLRDERLWKDGKELRLRRKPFAILRHLAENPQRLVTHAELVGSVWGKMVISESLLRTHVHDLRQAVGDEVIETVVGRGYRFLPAIANVGASLEPNGGAPAEVPLPLPSLVARDEELASLRSAMRDARERRRRVLFVTGDAGVGKTTLVDAFLEEVRSSGEVRVARGACVEQYGSGEAYLPLLEALGGLCRGRGGERVSDVLARHAPTWLAQMPALLPSGQVDDIKKRAMEATQPRMLREFAEALEALSVGAPVVLTLEDLQWCDPSTADAIAMFARRLQPARVVLLGTYRRGAITRGHPLSRVAAELVAHRQATEVEVNPFDEDALRAFLSARYSGHQFPEALGKTLHCSTGGNPLFLATLFDDLENRRMITRVDGRWALATSVDDVAARCPDSIRRLIDAQLDRLGATEQRIVEVASVVGITFTAGAVAHVLDASVDEIDSTCETLANDYRLLDYLGTETWPDGTIQSRYAFAHALFKHSALARNPAASVRLWHRRIAERIEGAHEGRVEEVAAELALHWDEGQVVAKALELYVLAGERALKRHGNVEALGHFRRARKLLASVPVPTDRRATELRILLGLGKSALTVEGANAEDLASAFDRAVALATELRDDDRLCAALVGRQRLKMTHGDLRAAGAHASALLDVAKRVKDPGLRLIALHEAAIVDVPRGRLREAKGALDKIAATRLAGEPLAASGPATSSFGPLSVLTWLVGNPEQALGMARESVRRAETLADPYAQSGTRYTLGIIHTLRREPELAHEHLTTALRIADREHLTLWQGHAGATLKALRAQLAPEKHGGEWSLDDWGGDQVGRTFHVLGYLEWCQRTGRTKRALDEIDRTLTWTEATDERFGEPELYRLRGELLHAVDEAEAERALAVAGELARKMGAVSFELRVALSQCRLATGAKRGEARERLRRTMVMFTEGFDTGDLAEARSILAQ